MRSIHHFLTRQFGPRHFPPEHGTNRAWFSSEFDDKISRSSCTQYHCYKQKRITALLNRVKSHSMNSWPEPLAIILLLCLYLGHPWQSEGNTRRTSRDKSRNRTAFETKEACPIKRLCEPLKRSRSKGWGRPSSQMPNGPASQMSSGPKESHGRNLVSASKWSGPKMVPRPNWSGAIRFPEDRIVTGTKWLK